MKDTRHTPDRVHVVLIAISRVARSAISHLAEGTPSSRSQLAEELSVLDRLCTELEAEHVGGNR